jgi:hypothetical protein
MINPSATFKIKSAFQLTGTHFYVLGDVLSGEIRIGMKADLTSIGIEKSFVIETVEFARMSENGEVWEEVGLGFSGLTDNEKELLETKAPNAAPIFIR